MRALNLSIFLITLLLASFNLQITNAAKPKRRILHQPLFPVDSLPPPSPPPPTPDVPDEEGQPFSNEVPTGPALDQSNQPPPLPYTVGTPLATPVSPTPPNSNHVKKLLIATSSTLVTLGMLLAMAFFLHKHRQERHGNESQRLVARVDEESRAPPPPFLCTAPPPARGLASSEANVVNGSPYHKVNYRPPPPPPPPPPRMSSPPPPMSSSDDDTHNTRFSSNDSPSSRYYNTSNKGNGVASKPLPHSKRTPPKSRFSTPSSPSSQPIASLGPLQSCKPLPFSPNITKFSPSPPPPGVVNHKHKATEVPIPPPPPPPPPRKNWAAKKHTSSPVLKQTRRSKSKSPSPKASPSSEKTRAMEEENNEGSRPKMKPLHWDKVRATADRATVWDHLKSTSFRLNEDAMESLFGCNSATPAPREAPTKFVLPSFEHENRILDSKKAQNIAILLRALNVTREEVSEALIDGNQEGLGSELFETLVKMAPSKEEEIKLRDYNDDISKLGSAERFLKAILEIPFAFKRVEALLYKANFNTEVKYLRKSFQTLERDRFRSEVSRLAGQKVISLASDAMQEASEELKNSRLFLKLLEAVLRTGNHMNDGTNRGDAKAFKLDTLLKLGDVKGKDGKTTLLHFVVQEVIRSEGEAGSGSRNLKFREEDFRREGLQVVAGLSKELGNVKRAAGMDSDVLSGYVSKLDLGLETVRHVVQCEMNTKFFDSMNAFLEEAGDEISRVKAEERKALALVKEVTQYFHGDDAKREGHPLRIFMVVRDFLTILDNVCKDVGRMHDRSGISAGSSFRISVPLLSRYNIQNGGSSDDDSM